MLLAQSTSNATPAWFALAGALGGVFLTSAVALITAVLNHRWQKDGTEDDFRREHLKLLRQERRDAYSVYLAAEARTLLHARDFAYKRRASESLDDSEYQAAIKSWEDTVGRITLLGDPELQPALTERYVFVDMILKGVYKGEWPDGSARGATYTVLLDAMRRDISP